LKHISSAEWGWIVGCMGRVEGAVQPGDEEMRQERIAVFDYPKWGP